MKTVVEWLFHHAAESPEKGALVVGNQQITYREMAVRTIAVADYFASLGVRKASTVILSADATAAFVYGYFACHLLSSICIPVDPKCSESRLDYIVHKTKPSAVFTNTCTKADDGLRRNVSELLNCHSSQKNIGHFDLPSFDGIADVLFTSGTTGDAKGVILTHGAIAAAATQINRFIGNSPQDREVMPLPLSHSFGLGRLRCNVMKGSTIILVPGFANPALIYRAMDRYSATGLASVPAGFAILLAMDAGRIARYVDQLKYIEIGSSPMPNEHKDILMEMLPQTRICMHYGLTEASRSVFIEFHKDRRFIASLGKPSPGVTVIIADDEGKECLSENPGHILIKGEHCATGYWNDEILTEKAFKNGWLDTGDIGYMDSQGYLYLLARESDVINVGGLKVSPVEIEEKLKTLPSIRDCACVGIRDPRGITGMAIKAFLVKSDSATEYPSEKNIDFILRTHIEPYKIPSIYQWIDEIPRTESGKIKRSDLLLI